MGGEELVGQNLGGTLGFSSLPVLVMCPGVFGCFGVLALALPSGEVWISATVWNSGGFPESVATFSATGFRGWLRPRPRPPGLARGVFWEI